MIEAAKEVERITDFIKNYFTNQKLGGIIIGLSGGKDSAVATALFVKALGKENVIGVTIPCHSNSKDEKDAEIIAKHYGIKFIKIDITNTFDSLTKEIKKLEDFTISEDSEINLKPRLRMSTLYYLAQMYTKKYKRTYIVSGNSNKCEEYVGYFTKGGDSVSDIKILADLTVEEIINIGKYLQVPKEILYKTPSDGLSNKSDEEKLGVTYEEITKVINHEKIDKITQEKIETLHKNSQHKFKIPTYYKENNKK